MYIYNHLQYEYTLLYTYNVWQCNSQEIILSILAFKGPPARVAVPHSASQAFPQGAQHLMLHQFIIILDQTQSQARHESPRKVKKCQKVCGSANLQTRAHTHTLRYNIQ